MRVLRSVSAWLRKYRKYFLWGIVAILIGWAGFRIYVDHIKKGPSPVPKAIAKQANFKILYPKGYDFDATSWRYIEKEKTVTFTVKNSGNPVVITERAVPLQYRDDEAAYSRFIGSLKPMLNFKVPLGDVSLVGFITAGDYKPEGKSGIMKAKGTLVIAHPEEMMPDEGWEYLFGSMVAN